MSESQRTEVTRRRRQGISPAAQASLPDDDDLLREILLRLPPQPSSLPRASAVCKRWRRLVTDPKFHRQFCAHHRKPPLLGVFQRGLRKDNPFKSILDPPDRIPPERFDLRRQTGRRADVLGCRHGRVLLLNSPRHKLIVCDPITGEHHHIKAPAVFRGLYINGDVLCAAADQGHVHGSCHSSPFKVVLMSLCNYKDNIPPIACVYSSETGEWGNLISTSDRCELGETNPGILVGNVLYWSSKSVSPGVYVNILDVEGFTDDIIEFDLDRQSLAVTKGPPSLSGSLRHQIRTEDGALGLAILLMVDLKCGRGKSIVVVVPHGCCRRPLKRILFLGSLLRLKDLPEGCKYWGMMRIMVQFLYIWVPMSTPLNLCQCDPGKFMKAFMPSTVILLQVSMHQPVDVMELKCCPVFRFDVLEWFSRLVHLADVKPRECVKQQMICSSLQIDYKRRAKMYTVFEVLGGAMLAQTVMDVTLLQHIQ